MGFFDLPRELRDEIYDLALEHDRAIPIDHRQPSTSDQGTLQLHVRAPEPRLRLVSRQFASEYYERSPSTDDICLSVTGRSPNTSLQSSGGFPYAAQASRVDIKITFDNFDDNMYCYAHLLATWMYELVTDMPCIKTFHLQVCFTIPSQQKIFNYFLRAAHRASLSFAREFVQVQLEKNRKTIIPLDKVDVMLIVPAPSSNDADSPGTELAKVGSWTPAGGYEVDVGVAELRRKFLGS